MSTNLTLSPEAQRKLASIDQVSEQAMKTIQSFLALVHAEFPIKDAGMGPDFKGTHSVILVGGRPQLNLWWEGKTWPVAFTY